MAFNIGSSFERCCRLCAEEQEVTIMIFSEEAEAMLLQNKLNKYLLIEVDEDDKLPKNICIKCCTKLQTVCDFIDTTRKAQELLMKRRLVMEQSSKNCNTAMSIKFEPLSDDEMKVTEMEVSVDPMMVLQNCEDALSPTLNNSNENRQAQNILGCHEETNLHSADGEYVTIKLIKKGDEPIEVYDDVNIINLMTEGKPFQCSKCKRSFMTELALKNHSWIHVSDDQPRRYRCNYCTESFDFKNLLIGHIKEHRVQGMCKQCGRVFRTQENLAAHMALHSTSGKSYTCKVCGRSYSNQSNLTTHGITHSNERPYKCHLCKKSFKRNQDLKFHINQHTGAKPYKCPFCDKSFASSGNCYSHRSRMHPGRRVDKLKRRVIPTVLQANFAQPRVPPPPKTILNNGIYKYQCTLCDHSFIRKDNYTYHMYQHTGEKPFQCTFCTEKFVTRRGLLLHHDKEHTDHNRPLALISKNILLK